MHHEILQYELENLIHEAKLSSHQRQNLLNGLKQVVKESKELQTIKQSEEKEKENSKK